ncbi:MAG: PEP/pyruvate-binding domain-containing protein [bacterium]
MAGLLHNIFLALLALAASELPQRLSDVNSIGHGFRVFFAGLFSMPIAAGVFVAAILTILIAALLVPITAALGLSASNKLFSFGAVILFAAVWAANKLIIKYRNSVKYRRSMIIPFHAAESAGVALTGFKGNGIGHLDSLGIAVPDGFIISGAVFERWILIRKLGNLIKKLAGTEEACERFEATLLVAKTPRFIKRKLKKALRRFGGDKIIVRSSFPGEDGINTSMAGVFESKTSNSDPDSAISTLIKVWASYFSPRATAAGSGAASAGVPQYLPVIVQRKIDHEVMFIGCSANYLNGVLEEMVISYETRGGAEGLVSFSLFTGNVAVIDGPGVLPFADSVVADLADILKKLEARFDKPTQIEAGLLNNNLYIYQARPLTGFRPADTLVNSFIVNINDFPLTPLSQDLFMLPDSLNSRMAKKLIPFGLPPGTELFRLHKGRYYLHYNSVRRYLNPHYLSLPRFALRSFGPSLLSWSRLLALGGFSRRHSGIVKLLKKASLNESASIRTLRDSVLLPLFKLQLDLFEVSDMIGNRYGAYVERVFSDKPDIAIQAMKLKTAPPDSPWKKMLDALYWLDPDNKNEAAYFQRQFGHWGNPESEVAAPRIAEDLSPWLALKPERKNIGRQSEKRTDSIYAAVENAFKRKWSGNVLNPGLAAFRFLLKRHRRTMSVREEIRDNLNRAMFEIKKKAMKTKFGGDAFFMTIDEIENGTPLPEAVEKRKADYRNFTDAHAEAVVHDPETAGGESKEPGVISCLGIGNEVVEGPALVADGPVKFVGGGKPALVVGRPDGIYGLVIRDISALVIERGSPLSHLVLLAREAGIPVLIGAAGVMKKVKSGDRLTIDAGKGTLRIG